MPGMRSTIKIKKFELPIYSCKMIFVYSNSFKAIYDFAVDEEFHEDNLKDLEEPYSGYTFEVEENTPKRSTHFYILVKKNKDKYEDIDTISHEVTHCVARIMESRGLPFNEHNEEAYAYLSGYLNKEFNKFKDGK